MRRSLFWSFLLAMAMLPAPGASQSTPMCADPPLSEQQIKNIIEKERAVSRDLPPPFEKSRTVLRRQGCHYVYIEYPIPQAPDRHNVFMLNQKGVIVDAEPGSVPCPEKVFTETELAEIIKNERAKRTDLPPPFPKSRARVDRQRCMYLYFEYAVPEARGNYQVFTIDPFGELVDVVRSKPY
jgi:hypothetical protein